MSATPTDNLNPPHRSAPAQHFHTLVLGYITGQNSLKDITHFVDAMPGNGYFLEAGANGNTHLHDALHFPFDPGFFRRRRVIPLDQPTAVERCKALLEVFFFHPKLMPALTRDQRQKIFGLTTMAGFTAPDAAVASGNLEIVRFIFGEVKQTLGADSQEYRDLCKNVTQYGFTLLQNAVKSGNLELVRFIFGELKHTLGADSTEYRDLCKNVTQDGFTLLQSAVKSGNLELVRFVFGEVRRALEYEPNAFQNLMAVRALGTISLERQANIRVENGCDNRLPDYVHAQRESAGLYVPASGGKPRKFIEEALADSIHHCTRPDELANSLNHIAYDAPSANEYFLKFPEIVAPLLQTAIANGSKGILQNTAGWSRHRFPANALARAVNGQDTRGKPLHDPANFVWDIVQRPKHTHTQLLTELQAILAQCATAAVPVKPDLMKQWFVTPITLADGSQTTPLEFAQCKEPVVRRTPAVLRAASQTPDTASQEPAPHITAPGFVTPLSAEHRPVPGRPSLP